MKILILITAILLASPTVFSQRNDPLQTPNYEALMKKSKSQKKTAWVFLAGGAAVSSLGMIIMFGEVTEEFVYVIGGPEYKKPTHVGEIFFYTGLAGMLGSIPFFIGSSKTRKKAEALHAYIQLRSIPYPGLVANFNKTYPSLTVRINL